MLEWLWLPALLIAAFWVRMPALDKPLWEDEATALRSASRAVRLLPSEAFSPRKWTDRLAYGLMETGSLAAVRLPYVAWGLVAIAMGWILGRQLRDRWLGAGIALILAFWPWRIYWDGLIRDYAVMAAWGMILWVAAERFRRRRTLPTFALLLALTIPAALVHELAVLLLPVPLIYLMWHGLRGCVEWITARVRASKSVPPASTDSTSDAEAGFATTPITRHALRSAVMIILLMIVLPTGLRWAVAPETFGKVFNRDNAEAESVSAPAREATPAAPAASSASIDQPSAKLPGPSHAFQFAAGNIAGAFGPHPSAGTLLGFRVPGPNHQPRALYEQIVMDLRGGIPVPRRLDLILLAGLILGTLALALRSPPLAACLWAVIWGTALIVDLNTHVRVPMDRYYTLPSNAAVILLAAGIAAPLRALRWLLLRRRLRWNARVVALGSMLALATTGYFAAPAGRNAAAHHNEDWRTFWRQTLRENPNGTFFTGERAVHFEAYKRLDSHGDNMSDSIRQAASRSIVNDASGWGWALDGNAAVFDHLNGMDALAIFRPGYRRNLPYMPLDRPDAFFEFETYDDHNLIAQTARLSGRAFVTRGQTPIGLLPHISGSTSRPAVIDTWFEVPGFHAVGFPNADAAQLNPITDNTGNESAVLIEGNMIEFEDVTSTHPLARKLFGERAFESPQHALQVVEIKPGERTGVPFSIGFDLARKFHELNIAFIEDEWTTTPSALSIGRIQQWRGEDGMPRFGFAVRIDADDSRLMYAGIQLRGQGATQPAASWRMQIDDPMRRLRAGDVLWSGDLAVERNAMPGIVGKPFSLSITPVALDVPIDDPGLSSRSRTPPAELERLIKPPQTTRIAYLRYRPTPEGMQLDVGR